MSLGKRKEREDEISSEQREYHGSTLFVSNLPYNATSTDLQTLFSDIAPVRNAFVVCEHGTGVSKGVGYVSFAIREDAQAAYDKISKEGFTLVGRSLRVQWAEQKPKIKKEKSEISAEKREPQKKRTRVQKPTHPNDPLAIRTIVISGLPTSIDSKALWKKIRKYEGAEKVEWPVTIEGIPQDHSTAHALFSNPTTALSAVNKLHAHVFKGSLLSVTLKKRLDTLATHKPAANLSKETENPKTQLSTPAPSHANRLIIRNLPFTATEQDLRSIFLPYGPIYSIHIPAKDSASTSSQRIDETRPTEIQNTSVKTEDEEEVRKTNDAARSQHSTVMSKGFAFIWFYSRKDAESAMSGCNGMTVRAGAAEELVKDKQKKKKERRMEKKLAALAAAKQREKDAERIEGEGGDESENQDGESNDITDVKEEKNERVIAVDWALSKDRWKEEKARIEDELRDGGENVDNELGSERDTSDPASDSGSDEDDQEAEEGGLGVHDGDSESGSETSGSDNDSVEGERDDDGEPVKPQLPATDVGTTLFIRNVPYDATEDELRTLFRTFGPLRYARITLDHATGRSRGTGFACFWNKEDADKVIVQSELLKAETTGGNTVSLQQKKNPFTLPSILTPDPSSSLAQSLVLHGRTLDVVRAVTRDEAGRLKEEGERAREKTDKRNMYLLREGVILPNSPTADLLSSVDLERRTNSYNARRTLLKSNPSLYISKTRLSIRQIPLYVTQRVLKRLALHAVRAFNREVKEGQRTALSAEELADPGGRPGDQEQQNQQLTEEHKGDDEGVSGNESDSSSAKALNKNAKRKAKLRKKLAGRKASGVKQAKIIRQAERVDPITGNGRSRGYGFIEMYTHADALRVLRWGNNNPEVHVLLREWWRDELKNLIKVEGERVKQAEKEKKGDDEKSDAKLKRMLAELERYSEKEEPRKVKGDEGEAQDSVSTRGSLIVEFSIENVQVVQRRNTIQKNRVSQKTEGGTKMLDDGQSPHGKARRLSTSNESKAPRFKLRPQKPNKRALEQEGDTPGHTEHQKQSGKQVLPKKRRLSGPSPKKVDVEIRESGNVTKFPKHEKETLAESPAKFGQKIGSIIGRKRKEKKGKKGKGKH
ncbi:hypothetical protein AX17_002197 [Amanita inopinata Kibby_2008]|nr:hypothetical protein AX17_002197 [Amanita inopinata Kibby_2008]